VRIWIADVNRFHLPPPPRWWQNRVSGYDKMLRLLPSQVQPVYRLCRLVRREARLGLQAMVVHDHPDTRMLIRHGCVPVATLTPRGAAWSPLISRDLTDRDMWAYKNADAVLAAIERGEQARAAAEERTYRDNLQHVNAEGFRSMKTALGERVSLDDVHRGRGPRRAKHGIVPRRHLDTPTNLSVQSPDSRRGSPAPAGGTGQTVRKIILTDL
jgi:hypothetical protein